MAVIGIEFTSRFAQFLIIVMVLIVAAGVVWLIRRFRRAEGLLSAVRRDNARLRNEVANVTGWTVDGRLPDDWQKKLQRNVVLPASQISSSAEASTDPVMLVAHHALTSVEPPKFASRDSNDAIEREHRRTVDLVEGLASGRLDPVPALANGDLDKLFCYWRRLETYFPDEDATFAYGIAANAVLGMLKTRNTRVFAPRPLTVASAKTCVLTTDDAEHLRDITHIRAAAIAAGSQLSALQAGVEVIVDCEHPGWNSPSGQITPRILILDKSW